MLALPIIGMVDEARAEQMMDALLAAIERTQARFAILDVTGAGAVDTTAMDQLLKLVRAAGLLADARAM